jgi:carbamoyl-phosphate synthase large subunit
MARILIGGAGGAPSNNFIRSLRESSRKDYLIGMTCVSADLFLADVDERHVIPPARSPKYCHALLKLIRETKPEFLHVQHDFEIQAISKLRDEIRALGVRLFLPSTETIDNCVDKYKSYKIWKQAGIRVPETLLIRSAEDLAEAFKRFGGKVWLRASEGAGGTGSLPADVYDFARSWLDRFDGWGSFTAAEMLTPRSITWLSIWHEGELVVAQTRLRRSWNFGNRAVSGVTGITGVAETCSDDTVTGVATASIRAVETKPHGIFAVDMTYDSQGFPNPTEINIGRFFTTHYFFTKAGLNMPEIYCDIALEGRFPKLERKINPLPCGLVWIRGMDVEPAMTTVAELERLERALENQ